MIPTPLVRRLRLLRRRLEVGYRGPRVARLLTDCGALLSAAPKQRVVLVVSRANRRLVDPWLAKLSEHRVLVVGEGAARRHKVRVRPTSSLPEIHDALRSFGAVHLVVDLRSRDLAESRETWQELFFHLRPGGAYLVPASKAATADLRTWTAELAGLGPADVLEPSLRDAIAGVALQPHGLAIIKRGHHCLAMLDDEVMTLLPEREPGAKVELLRELPGGVFESRVEVASYGATVEIGGFSDRLAYPPLRLRHYQAPIVFAGRTLMFTGHSVLPDSYRFFRADRVENPILRSITPDLHTVPPGYCPREDLEGDYFVLDAQWTGHFGHIMTEVVPRLWAWDEAKARFPDLKVLFAVKRGESVDPLMTRLLRAYGIAETDLVGVEHPVRVRSVLAATAMWHNWPPHFVHPRLTEIWDRIGANIATVPAVRHDRIFVSRGPSLRARACQNSAAVEEFFSAHGFTVVYPEELDLAEQAGIFSQATVIAGFGGSAMFSLMYARRMQHLILLSHEWYTARNEHLYSSLLGGKASYFWSSPDSLSYTASWSFDFERNQKALEEVLAELDR